jgi:hypothetical protein
MKATAPAREKEEERMATYVLVHGAWHTGELLEDTAKPMRAKGHQVHCPTLELNIPVDSNMMCLV